MSKQDFIGYSLIILIAGIIGWMCVSICGGQFFLMNVLGWASAVLLIGPIFIAVLCGILGATGKDAINFYPWTFPTLIGIIFGSFLAYEIKDPPSDVNVCTALSDKE